MTESSNLEMLREVLDWNAGAAALPASNQTVALAGLAICDALGALTEASGMREYRRGVDDGRECERETKRTGFGARTNKEENHGQQK